MYRLITIFLVILFLGLCFNEQQHVMCSKDAVDSLIISDTIKIDSSQIELDSLVVNEDTTETILPWNPKYGPSTGEASWYGPGFQGKKTASGRRYDMYELTAAHRTLPFDTKVKVTLLNTGLSVVVTITDRGPFIRGRIIDLSKASKNAIGMGGTGQVKIEIVE